MFAERSVASDTPNPEAQFRTLAAVDLGSNSFHMIVATLDDGGRIQVIDRMREMVRLASGLTDDGRLDDNAVERACDCLARFGERLRDLPRGSVRAVGTNTLRKATNSFSFISAAEKALGHPIDVISGFEEARLIYLGVSHGLEDDNEIRLVLDIGGGSTECILGRSFQPLQLESLHIGCVSMSTRFFGDGSITADAMQRAEIAAQQEIESIERSFRSTGWQSVIGASGTILAIYDVLKENGWSRSGINSAGLASLRKALIDAGHIDKLSLSGVSDERLPVFPGGVAVLLGLFEGLGLTELRVSSSALREGLLYDFLGRLYQSDIREQTISDVVRRYDLDADQGERIASTAAELVEQVTESWQLPPGDPKRLLRWAAQLHEIGTSISHSQYHKHGAYMLKNLDMPGFSRREQQQLAVLVRSHRRKIPQAEFDALPEDETAPMMRLALLMRLATLLHRRRSTEHLPENIGLRVDGTTLKLKFPAGWLDDHPLTSADLETEAQYQKSAGHKLKFK
ncbi:MAG: exopolyphosphatase [Gammaproteobacteria bacterium]|nr:exopolyphosphatase [Gammaproteobacteria bacterium]NNM00464.1 exopolyphosphatase [Gammaproteobacteria bacterium]